MNKRPRQLVLVVALAISAAALVALTVKPGGALATVPSRVTAFDDAPLAPRLREIATKVAAREGLAAEALVAVAPTGGERYTAGVFVATDALGRDLLAPYTSDGMTGFVSVEQVSGYGGVIVVPSAVGDGPDVTDAALVGVAEPRVAKVTLTLAGGELVDAGLVEAGSRSFKFFAYVADSAARFPVSYRAYATDGSEVKGEDVRSALTPPAGPVR